MGINKENKHKNKKEVEQWILRENRNEYDIIVKEVRVYKQRSLLVFIQCRMASTSVEPCQKRQVWFITVWDVSEQLLSEKQLEIMQGMDLLDFHVQECVTCEGKPYLHLTIRSPRPYYARHVAGKLSTILGVPIHCNTVRNPMNYHISAEIQFRCFSSYGVKAYSDFKDKGGSQVGDSKKPTAREMVDWAKSQVGLCDEDVIDKYPHFIYRTNTIKHLIKLSKPQGALKCTRNRNFWLWSPPGNGKNTFMRELIKANQWRVFKWPMTEESKWADGYNREAIIWIDEIDPLNCPPLNLLKTLSDVEECSYQVKGSVSKIRAKMVVDTSNYTVQQCYPNRQDASALLSRFTQIPFPHYQQKIQLSELGKKIKAQYDVIE